MRKEKTAIVKIEGGICSQILCYTMGKMLQEKEGYCVKYDLSWYETDGMDSKKLFVRNYDLEKAFPSLNIEKATPNEIETAKNNSSKDKIYVQNHDTAFDIIEQYEEFFKSNFKPYDLDSIDNILNEIKNTSSSCAVHVRRGDLTTFHPYYGEPTQVSYFFKTTNRILKENAETTFFFFSDEPDYVFENIIPNLSPNIKYKVITQNNSDKGYLDLYLMSMCNYIIASQGSMGKFAKFLSNTAEFLIVPKSTNKQIPV